MNLVNDWEGIRLIKLMVVMMLVGNPWWIVLMCNEDCSLEQFMSDSIWPVRNI
jgi:hypothetical protein